MLLSSIGVMANVTVWVDPYTLSISRSSESEAPLVPVMVLPQGMAPPSSLRMVIPTPQVGESV